MHKNAGHVARCLAELGVAGQVSELAEPAPTAATAAAQLGCEAPAIANSLLFAADGEPLLVLTSGAHRIDTALADYPQVWAAAGHAHSVFPATFTELVRITSGPARRRQLALRSGPCAH